MTTRNRAHSTSLRGGEVEYFLCIQGLSPQCRWQELKDVIRKIPPDGHIRQAHTDNENGTGWGHITILNKRKAFDTYDYLYDNGWRGHSIRLTLVVKDEKDTNALRTLRGPEDSLVYPSQRSLQTSHLYPSQSPTMLPQPVSSIPHISVKGNYSCSHAATTNLGTSPTASMYQSVAPVAMQPLIPLQQLSLHDYSSCPPSTTPASQRLVQQSPPSPHSTSPYRHKPSGNRPSVKPSTTSSSGRGSLSSSTNDSEGRTVYLYNLPYTVSQQAIKEHLASAGMVDRILVKEDRQRSPKHKLTAVATFRTPQQAQTAIDRFNKSMWKGYEIKVKLDRGPTASGASVVRNSKSSTTSRAKEDRRETAEGPLVVNGSGPSISSRHTRVDSDDESSCDDGK